MNMKLRLAVVATLLLTGCQTLPNRNDAGPDEQQTAQTVNKTRSAIDRSASEQSRISVWRHASNEMKMEIPNRAEVIAYDDFIQYKGEAGAKEAGKWRLEGKEYEVQDGDIIEFRFNV